MRLDPVKVDFYRIRAELTAVELRENAGIQADTWEKILRGDDIWLESAVNVRMAIWRSGSICDHAPVQTH